MRRIIVAMIGRLAAVAATALLAAGCAEAGNAATPTALPDVAALATPVRAGDIVVVAPNGHVVEVARTGATVRTLAQLALPIGTEVDAIDVSPDRRRVLVSTLADSDDERQCDAAVYSIATDHTLRHVADGAAATWAPDGTRFAYLRYGFRSGFCKRVSLQVRTTATRSERGRALAAGPVLEGTPPEWPVNWSPDSTKVAYVGADGISIATVTGRWTDTALHPRFPALAPVFLTNTSVGANTGCCAGDDNQLRSFALDGTLRRTLFDIGSPIRSIRRDRSGTGLWLTTEGTPDSLYHWDGADLTRLARAALVTSG